MIVELRDKLKSSLAALS